LFDSTDDHELANAAIAEEVCDVLLDISKIPNFL
jgi:hypothetical protein